MALYVFSYCALYCSIMMYRKREIIISMTRSKGVNEKLLCLCTSHQYHIPTCAISWLVVLWFLSFVSSTARRRRRIWTICEIPFCIYNTPHIILSHNFWDALNIWHALNLDTTKGQIASIVKVKIANFKCTGLMLRTLANPCIHLLL